MPLALNIRSPCIANAWLTCVELYYVLQVGAISLRTYTYSYAALGTLKGLSWRKSRLPGFAN